MVEGIRICCNFSYVVQFILKYDFENIVLDFLIYHVVKRKLIHFFYYVCNLIQSHFAKTDMYIRKDTRNVQNMDNGSILIIS